MSKVVGRERGGIVGCCYVGAKDQMLGSVCVHWLGGLFSWYSAGHRTKSGNGDTYSQSGGLSATCCQYRSNVAMVDKLVHYQN